MEVIEESWHLGQMKFFDSSKGFGFAECFSTSIEYFVHISQVKSESLSDDDLIVFKLRESRRKKGTQETVKVYLLSDFNTDSNFLETQYRLNDKSRVREQILNNLSYDSVMTIFKEELHSFYKMETMQDYYGFKSKLDIFNSSVQEISVQETISNKISEYISQIATKDVKFELWIDDVLDVKPDQNIIDKYYKISKEELKYKILRKCSKEKKISYIRLYSVSDKESLIEFCEFIIGYLLYINGLFNIYEIKCNLFNVEYWKDRRDYFLYEEVFSLVEYLSEDDKIELFVEGYLPNFSVEYILKREFLYSDDYNAKFLSSDVMSESERYRLIQRICYEVIENYNSSYGIPNAEIDNLHLNEYSELIIKQVRDVLILSKRFLSGDEVVKIRNLFLREAVVPNSIKYNLWVERYFPYISFEIVLEHLIIVEEIQEEICRWLRCDLYTKSSLSGFLEQLLVGMKAIEHRKDFYLLHNLLIGLDKSKEESLDKIILDENRPFYNLSRWISDASEYFNFDEFKTRMVFLKPPHQILFLRKLFMLKYTNSFDLSIDNLLELTRIDYDLYKINEAYNPEVLLDITVDVIINAIKSYSESGKFLMESDMLTIVLKDLSADKKHEFQISELFEKCKGRTEMKYDWSREGEITKVSYGHDQFYYAIFFPVVTSYIAHGYYGSYNKTEKNPMFDELKDLVKQLPGRKWNDIKGHWGVPAKYEKEVKQFAKDNRFYFDIEGSNYENNTHLANASREVVPNGIIYCEGRMANKEHQTYKREFWWCCNQACFDNCESVHKSEEWNKYTLLDFLVILGYSIDGESVIGDIVDMSKYYLFVSTINRFNRLLEKLYCKECGEILSPISDSHFAHYRAVRFHCENSKCKEYHKEIYLHHCLNGKCTSIIDSRESKKCPNGLYICSNEECGCCCSDQMFNRKLSNIELVGGEIPNELRVRVNEKLGHLERSEHYCYKCGKIMEQKSEDIFECRDCHISYDVSSSKFKRPNKLLSEHYMNYLNDKSINDSIDSFF